MSIREIDTLPDVVRAVAKEAGIKPENCAQLIQRATDNIPSYFKRIYTPLNSQVVEVLFDDFLITSREIMDQHGKRKEKNIGRHCSWCDFEQLCRAELTGSDVDYVKETEYVERIRTPKDEARQDRIGSE